MVVLRYWNVHALASHPLLPPVHAQSVSASREGMRVFSLESRRRILIRGDAGLCKTREYMWWQVTGRSYG